MVTYCVSLLIAPPLIDLQSKLANILFANELQKRLDEQGVKNVYVNSLHPGSVATNLATNARFGSLVSIGNAVLTSVEGGAATQASLFYTQRVLILQIYLSVHPEVVEKGYKGKYFVPMAALTDANSAGRDMEMAKKLWAWTEDILKEKGFFKDWSFSPF